jgi:hypothetical protein
MSVPQICDDVTDLLPPTCSLCERDAARCAPVGPIFICIEEPEFSDSPIETVFCCWEFASTWFQIQAGRVSPDHGKCYRKYGGNC